MVYLRVCFGVVRNGIQSWRYSFSKNGGALMMPPHFGQGVKDMIANQHAANSNLAVSSLAMSTSCAVSHV